MVTISVAPGAQELDAGLVADLDPAAGEQRDAAAQVGGLGALGVVELGARRAELVVEVVDVAELLLAHVAVLRVAQPPLVAVSSPSPRRSSGSNPSGGNTLGVVNTGFARSRRMPVPASTASSRPRVSERCTPLARLGAAPALVDVGAEHVAGRVHEPDAFVLRHHLEHRRIGDDAFQQLRRRDESAPGSSSESAM